MGGDRWLRVKYRSTLPVSRSNTDPRWRDRRSYHMPRSIAPVSSEIDEPLFLLHLHFPERDIFCCMSIDYECLVYSCTQVF